MTIEVDADTRALIEAMRKPEAPIVNRKFTKYGLAPIALNAENIAWLQSMGYAGESFNDVITRIRLAYQNNAKQ